MRCAPLRLTVQSVRSRRKLVPEFVCRSECGVAEVVPGEAVSHQALDLNGDVHQRGLPLRALESNADGDQESDQPDLGARVTGPADGSAEPLVVEVIEAVKHQREQTKFLLTVDHCPRMLGSTRSSGELTLASSS